MNKYESVIIINPSVDEEGIKALIETCQELGVTKKELTGKLQEKYHLSENEAFQYIEKYWK